MEKQIYMFDVDGVLADSWAPLLDTIRQELGLVFAYEDLDHYAAIYDLVLTKTDEKTAKWADDQWFVSEVLRKSLPASGAVEALRGLVDRDISFFACTSRLACNRASTMEWFEEYFPFMPRENIFIRNEMEERTVSGDEFKQGVAAKMTATRHYDDSLTALKQTSGSGVSELVLISRPWNKHDHDEHLRYDRSNSVFEHLVQ